MEGWWLPGPGWLTSAPKTMVGSLKYSRAGTKLIPPILVLILVESYFVCVEVREGNVL